MNHSCMGSVCIGPLNPLCIIGFNTEGVLLKPIEISITIRHYQEFQEHVYNIL